MPTSQSANLSDIEKSKGVPVVFNAQVFEVPVLPCPHRSTSLARELVRLDVDLLFVSGDQGVKAAKEATDSIPIVVVACDPIESMVVSIARLGGKVTGASCISSDLAGKRSFTTRTIGTSHSSTKKCKWQRTA
jgi:hypothetical protein